MTARRGLALALGAVLALVLAAAASRWSGTAWSPPDAPVRIASSHLADVAVTAPTRAPIGLAAIVSDARGPGVPEHDLGARLRARGFIVLQLDLPRWRAALEHDPDACIRPIVDVELLAKEAQRALGASSYHRPILFGRHQGGAWVRAMLARALPATLGGGVAVEPDAVVAATKPLCDDGAPVAATQRAGDGFLYPLPARMQAPLTTIRAHAPTAPSSAPAAGYGAHAARDTLVPDPPDHPAAAIAAGVDIAAQDAAQVAHDGLPVIDLPAEGPPRALALFLSGDGGWRDIDKRIGEQLTRDGVHVVGLDALRYFWSVREPQATAADLARLVEAADPAHRLPVLVLGYSFGADVFPFSWPHWPDALKARTRLIALLGPNRSTGFSVTVTGWLGYGGDHAVVPALAALPLARVLCVHGAQETDSACAAPEVAAARRVRLEGGHHFDGDYAAIARLIAAQAGLDPPPDRPASPAPRETP